MENRHVFPFVAREGALAATARAFEKRGADGKSGIYDIV
jgi:hypothetical protein